MSYLIKTPSTGLFCLVGFFQVKAMSVRVPTRIIQLLTKYERRCEKTGQSSGFPTRSDTNRAVQPQKMARGLKLCI